jgi:hypothetical protein
VCAGQAIEESTPNHVLRNRVATEFIKTIAPDGSACIPGWNDRFGRRQAEVVAAFDRTIRRLTTF